MQEHELRASPDEVAKYLQGAHFPTHKKELIEYAKQHKAPYGVVRDLEIVKDEIFDNLDDVKEGVTRVLHRRGKD